ncbi:MAG: hypothetical protein SWC96_07995 [Thermodesulfobacteriota bacterium]|nr:hypothetical protein [Thermodesulfobacteriota bacterium]
MTPIDARNLLCPGPVLAAKSFIEQNDPNRITIMGTDLWRLVFVNSGGSADH